MGKLPFVFLIGGGDIVQKTHTMIYNIVISLGYLPEFEGKTILMKTPNTPDTGLR